MRSTSLFLFVFLAGCGSVFNGSTVSYKAPVLEPGHGTDAKGRMRCTVRRTGTEMTVVLNGSPTDVARGFDTMNGGTFVNSGIYLYNCALAELAGTSVGGGSDDEALAIATETQRAFEDYLVEKAKEGGGGQSSDASPAPTEQPSAPRSGILNGILNLFKPSSAPVTQPVSAPAPTPIPAQSSAPVPSVAPIANLCQGINSANSFAELAGVYERTANVTVDTATRAAYFAKVRILQAQAEKPTQDQQLYRSVQNAMSIEDACR